MRFHALVSIALCYQATTQAFILPSYEDLSSNSTSELPLLLEARAGGGTPGSTSGTRPGTGTGSSGTGTRPGTPRVVLPSLPKAPTAATREYTPEDASRFKLGTYKIEKPRVLFRNFEEPADLNYFAQIFTFFAADASAETVEALQNTYDNVRGNDNPFQPAQRVYQDNGAKLTGQALKFPRTYVDSDDGRTHLTTSTFLPQASKSVCGAWSSLVDYCDEGGMECACFSGTYYVPEMYNSLAAKCASGYDTNSVCAEGGDDDDKYWCSVQSHAATHTDYCDSAVATAVRFAQRANTAPRSTAASTTTAVGGDDDDDEESMSDTRTYDTTYTQPGRTIAPAPTLEPVPSSTEASSTSASITSYTSTSASLTSAVVSSTTVPSSSAASVRGKVRAAGEWWILLAAPMFIMLC